MGEIADAMLDGTLCECCGEYIGSDVGYPQYCSPQCAGDRGADIDPLDQEGPVAPKPFACGQCGRRFREDVHRAQHCKATGHAL